MLVVAGSLRVAFEGGEGAFGAGAPGPGRNLSLHTVLAGELTCERDGAPMVRARQGDLLLIPGGRYRFVHQPGAPAQPVAEAMAHGPLPGTARSYSAGGGPQVPDAARDRPEAELDPSWLGDPGAQTLSPAR
jgi:hypothetical protein